MVDLKIMAHPKRTENVQILLEKLQLPESSVIWENRPNGGDAMYTAKRAWLAPFSDGATHRAVIQDDVVLCNNLLEILEKIAITHPNYAFAGATMDWPFRVIEQNTTPYYGIPSLWGPMIMLPRKIIKPCMDWCDKNENPITKPHDDLSISEYCYLNDILMFSSYPNLIQHLDNGSLIGDWYTWERKSKTFDPNPVANWESKNILKPY